MTFGKLRNEKFSVTNDPQWSLLTEFWGNNYAHVILTGEADSLPKDEKELLNDCGFVGCHSSKSNDLSVHARINSLGKNAFYGNQMLMTEMDIPQSLKSNLARPQTEQSRNRASDLLSSSYYLWRAATSVQLRTPLSLQQVASMTPKRGNAVYAISTTSRQ